MPPDGATGADLAGLTIRVAEPNEYDAIAAVLLAAYEQLDDPEFPGYRSELRAVAKRAASCPVLVAVDSSGTVLGTVTYVPGPDTPLSEGERDGEAGFRMLAVDPAAHGKGIGRVLARTCIERARSEGRTAVHLYTRPSMRVAHRLYESMGFERDRSRDWEFEPGEWLWSYHLAL